MAAKIIVRRPRRELMGPPPEGMEMDRGEVKLHAFDPTFPTELEGLLAQEDWTQIVEQLDKFWIPLFQREGEIERCSVLLCCCCCCTGGITLCAMCCYQSCSGRGLDKRKIAARREIKSYFEELNKNHGEQGIHFSVSPTVKTFYIEIRVAQPGASAAETNNKRNSRASVSTEEEHRKEEEPLLKPTHTAEQPSPSYGTQNENNNLEGLD